METLKNKDKLDLENSLSSVLPTLESEKPSTSEPDRWLPFAGLPREPYASHEASPVMPLVNASLFSQWTWGWVYPIIATGYQRTLVPLDLWKLPEDITCGVLADRLQTNFTRRKEAVEKWNKEIDDGTYKPWIQRRLWWKFKKSVFGFGDGDGKRTVGLFGALSDTFFYMFWSAGVLKVVADLCTVTSPLVIRALINFATNSYYAHHSGTPLPSVGRGIGLGFVLWALQVITAFCTHQFFGRSGTSGVLARGALIAAIYRRSLVLSQRSRMTITNGHLINHISTDVSRIDYCATFFHGCWTSLTQLIVIIIILLVTLGPASLAGIAVLVLILPSQSLALKHMFRLRIKAMVWTDQRVKLISELLGGMKIIKFFAWEIPYIEKLEQLRSAELLQLRTLLIIRAGNAAMAICIPMLSTVVALITYAALGHSQNPAIIFTSLSLFNLVRMPLQLLPMALSTISDAYNAIGRLTLVFLAEVREDSFNYDPLLPYAIKVEDADFVWDVETSQDEEEKGVSEDTQVLQLRDLNLKIPRGQLCAIVGAVGSGKSSLLQGLIGEMKRTKGSVTFSGSLAYCPQAAWIQNETLKENILFGLPFDEDKYRQVIYDACLEADIAMLPQGENTPIGEKGVNLSGGQKQRINIARALYFDADIVLLDDPLSAVDAHVGKHIFDYAICGGLADKTRVLVTHAVHFLPSVDYIICFENGKITQQGTYPDLIADEDGAFSTLIRNFGGGAQQKKEEEEEEEAEAIEKAPKQPAKIFSSAPAVLEEQRSTGALSNHVLWAFLRAAKGKYTVPLLLGSLSCMQVAQIVGSYWLVWWQEDYFHSTQGVYMGMYGLLGVLQVIFTFMLGASAVVIGYNASKGLHTGAVQGVLRAPMSFFDQSPLGRIMNRFSKDIDTIDNTLNDSFRQFFAMFSSCAGALILVAVVQPPFLVALAFIFAGYLVVIQLFRASGRDLKRLDNFLRSSVYAHFSESLSGLPTIRAYAVSKKFQNTNEQFVDRENEAYYLTVVNQRWLALRLDMLSSILTLIVALISVARRTSVTPSKTGLILSCIITSAQGMTWLVRFATETEYDFNSVERVLQYAEELPQEAPAIIEDHRPDPSWPSQGGIELKNVVMSYRTGLPPVLKGLSLSVAPGEKIGVVGRTGAGKSSIMTALFRLVELTSGAITIDGVDISTIGLADLREKISILPQDALLFNGTIRTNLDPFGVYDDQVLWDALKRSWLVDQDFTVAEEGEDAKVPVGRFSLDSVVGDEGSNLSVGERSLVSLARALVKDSKIIILDEATAAVDVKTDALIQDTIRQQFSDKTLLCIAHRLRTILEYDRIVVMAAGNIAEVDTPIKLYRQRGIFHGMCERSSISEADIIAVSKL